MVSWVNQNLLGEDQVKNVLKSHQIFLSQGILRLLSIPSLRKVRGRMPVKKLLYFSTTMQFHLVANNEEFRRML